MKNDDCLDPGGTIYTSALHIFYGHQEPQRLKEGVFPQQYSLVEKGWVTPVKKQGVSNCWSYTAMALAETYLLRHEMLKSLPYKDDYQTLSETYATYSMIQFPGGFANPEGRKNESPDLYGATFSDAAAFLTRKPVCVPECLDPQSKTAAEVNPRDHVISFGKPKAFRVTGLRFIEDPAGTPPDKEFIEDIKYCLLSYGAIGMDLNWDKAKYMTTATHEGISRLSYYCYDASASARIHTVTIAGWDDKYEKENFGHGDTAKQPRANGAFLVKNSHGTGGARGSGFFWLSYEDQSMRHAYCITDMRYDSADLPADCLHYDTFGMSTIYLEEDMKESLTYACNFTLPADADLTDIGIYAFTPCLADIKVTPASISIKNQKLAWAGYHVLPLKTPADCKKDAVIKISVTFRTLHHIPVFVPLEYGSREYANAKLEKNTCFIGETDLFELSQNKTYGSIPLRAYITYKSSAAAKTAAAAKALRLPAEKDGRINDLPDKQNDCDVAWRLEPYQIKSYQPGAEETVKTFSVTDEAAHKVRRGIQNISGQNAITACLCAAVGAKPHIMRLMFKASLGKVKPAEIQATPVAAGSNVTNLSGTFAIPGASVRALIKRFSSDGSLSVRTATVDQNGSWQIPAFVLYDPSGGWKDAYSHNLVEVMILADDNFELCSGEKDVPAQRPYKPKPDPVPGPSKPPAFVIYTIVGLFAALADLTPQLASEIELQNNLILSASFLRSLSRSVNTEVPINGGGHTIYTELTDTSLMDEVLDVHDLNVEFTAAECPSNAAKNVGGIARKVKSGGTLKNCEISGSVTRFSNFGGLFCEGSSLTVSNCSINLSADKGDSFGGIALSMDSGSITGCNVNCTIQDTKKVAGGVLAMGSAASIKNSSFAVHAAGASSAGGASLKCSGIITQTQVTGRLSASGDASAAGGIAACLSGSSQISDCRVSASVSADFAGGIAAKMEGSAKTERCLTACRIIGGSTSFGIAPGISGKDSSVKNCISACSHLDGQSLWRTAQHCTDCGAYEGMTCGSGKSFAGTDTLLSLSRLLTKEVYTSRGWNFSSVWEITKGCPVLRGQPNPGYDFPFVNPDIPKNGFVFARGKAISVTGVCNPKAQVVWSIAPSGKSVLTGKAVQSGESFSITAGIFPGPAMYDFSVISILDGQRYPYPVKVQVL